MMPVETELEKRRGAHVTQMCSRLLGRSRLRCRNRIDAYRRVRARAWCARRGQCAATEDLELAALR
jgi:hypothetical protein